MGSPLGPTLINLLLAYHENNWLANCPFHFKPKVYQRYVDDLFVMFESKDHVKKFFKYLNSRHPNIKFTYEEEVNNKLSFLDILIERINNKLLTSLYCKSTFSGVYMNFHSFLPLNYKKGLIYTLLHCGFNISFHY